MGPLLAYQSTGNEERDSALIQERLLQGKKVSVILEGCEEEVRFSLGLLFGWDSVVDVKCIDRNSITFSETWQCSLHRDPSKEGSHAREYERALRQEQEREQAMQQEDQRLALTGQEFVSELGELATSIDLHHFDIHRLPAFLIDQWRRRFAMIWERPSTYAQLKGAVAERIVPDILKEHLSMELRRLVSVFASDLRDTVRNTSFGVFSGADPGQVLFTRGSTRYIELDALFRTPHSKDLLALDVTTQNGKKFRATERTQRLDALSNALGRQMLLIDVVLKDGKFVYEKITDRMYRWHLPTTLNFERVLEQIVAR
jgi:hypothetical protein